MAKPKAKKQSNAAVKVTTTTVNRVSGRRNRRRALRRNAQGTLPRTTVTETTKLVPLPPRTRRVRQRRRRDNGRTPPSLRQKITATLGTVGANQGDTIELEMAALLNPALVKESTGSNAYGPLQMYASNYNLWRCNYVKLKLQPLVGSSAVSGTAVRASLNMTGTPGSPSWSALGARYHRDTNPGRPLTMRIRGNQMLGPKEGWFLTNTKNDPQMCISGSVEIHTFGKTVSTYTNNAFTGPLFLAELEAEWEFKNYNPEPGMLNLVKTETQEAPQTVKIHSKPGEPITISVPNDSTFARVTGGPNPAADATPSEIIWQVCDTAMDLIEGVLPQPFQWLFRGGWWFLKRIANKKAPGAPTVAGEPEAGEITFQVFQSIQDAQNNVPCIATGEAASTNASVTGWDIQQITPGNVGLPQASTAELQRAYPIIPEKPIFALNLAVSSTSQYMFNQNWNGQGQPQDGFMIQQVGGSEKAYSYFTFVFHGEKFIQQDPDQFVDPSSLGTPRYPIYAKQGQSNFRVIGEVYASNSVSLPSEQAGTKVHLQQTIVLWRATNADSVRIRTPDVRGTEVWITDPNLSFTAGSLPNTRSVGVNHLGPHSIASQSLNIKGGSWYLTVFGAFDGTVAFFNYGIPFYNSTKDFSGLTGYSWGRTEDSIFTGLTPTWASPIALWANGMKPQQQETAELASFSSDEVLRLRRMLEQTGLDTEESESEPELLISEGSDSDTETEERDYPETPEPEEGEHFENPPKVVLEKLTEEGRATFEKLISQGVPAIIARRVAQESYPHPCYDGWRSAYHDALLDGASPPTARSLAWEQACNALSSRGHAE